MKTMQFQSSNIKCGGCVTNVENGLKTLAGVTNVSVDIPSNIVSVEGSELDKAAIETKLAELGCPVK